MDDIMDNMTRAEYVLLAMRLPRMGKDSEKDGTAVEDPKIDDSNAKSAASEQNTPKPGVLWGVKNKPTISTIDLTKSNKPGSDNDEEDEARYRALIMGNSKAETDNGS